MEPREVDLKKIFHILWKWKTKIILFVFIITTLSVCISLLLPKWYKAKAVVLVPESTSTSINPMDILGDLGLGPMTGGNENIFRYLAILKSRSLKELMINKFNLKEHYNSKYSELAMKELDDNMNFEVGDEFQVEISMLDKNQNLVADMANYIVHCLDSLNIELSVSNARNNRLFMEKRLISVTDSLNLISGELADFMKENRIISLEDQSVLGVQQAAFIKSQIIQKEVELEVAKSNFNEDNFIIFQKQNELNSLKNKYMEFLNNNSVSELVPNFSEIPNLQLQLIKLQRKAEYYSRLVEFLGPMYEQQKFEEAKNIPTLQVLDYAVTPELKAKPKRATIVIIVFFISGLIAVSYSIIKDSTE